MRAEMIKQGSYKSITTMANEHNINHLGRFSKQYKEFFGNLPSGDNKFIRLKVLRTQV